MADHKITVKIEAGAKKKKPSDSKPKSGPAGGGGAAPQLAGAPQAPQGTNPMTVSAAAPVQGGNPSGNPAGQITPTPTADVRQVRENINFTDMPPAAQSQVMSQQGVNMNAPQEMLQQGVDQAVQGGPDQALVGPGVPPGVESLPGDIAHLHQLMQQGFSPGSSPQEHALGQNAEALYRAKEAFSKSQEMEPTPQAPGAYAPQLAPPTPPGPPGMGGPPMGAPPGGPPMGGPPQAPGAPGGIPPEMIQALMAEAQKKKQPVR